MRLPLLWPAFVALAAGLLAPAPHRHAPAMRARPAFHTYSPLRMAEGGAREEVLDETEELDDASPSGLVPSKRGLMVWNRIRRRVKDHQVRERSTAPFGPLERARETHVCVPGARHMPWLALPPPVHAIPHG